MRGLGDRRVGPVAEPGDVLSLRHRRGCAATAPAVPSHVGAVQAGLTKTNGKYSDAAPLAPVARRSARWCGRTPQWAIQMTEHSRRRPSCRAYLASASRGRVDVLGGLIHEYRRACSA